MKIIEKPHLPDDKCTLCIATKDMFLPGFDNFKIIYSKESSNILSGINFHPDMQVCHLKNKDIVVSEEFYSYYDDLLSGYGFNVMVGKNTISPSYPNDIALNCVVLKNTVYHKLSGTDKTIIEYAEINNMEMLDVKQGYTKCSTYIIDETTVMTSDKGLYNAYEKNGIEVIFIDSKNILLPGFDCGFIGGCGGKISNDTLYFSGNIEYLPEYNLVMDLVSKKNCNVIYPKDRKLTDYGSIIPLVHI